MFQIRIPFITAAPNRKSCNVQIHLLQFKSFNSISVESQIKLNSIFSIHRNLKKIYLTRSVLKVLLNLKSQKEIYIIKLCIKILQLWNWNIIKTGGKKPHNLLLPENRTFFVSWFLKAVWERNCKSSHLQVP